MENYTCQLPNYITELRILISKDRKSNCILPNCEHDLYLFIKKLNCKCLNFKISVKTALRCRRYTYKNQYVCVYVGKRIIQKIATNRCIGIHLSFGITKIQEKARCVVITQT